MHQIKAEWLMFHIMYVTQLFFLGHMTHFVKVRQSLSQIITFRCTLRLCGNAARSVGGRSRSGCNTDEFVAAISLQRACRNLVSESSGFPPYIPRTSVHQLPPTAFRDASSRANTAHHCRSDLWANMRILHFP